MLVFFCCNCLTLSSFISPLSILFSFSLNSVELEIFGKLVQLNYFFYSKMSIALFNKTYWKLAIQWTKKKLLKLEILTRRAYKKILALQYNSSVLLHWDICSDIRWMGLQVLNQINPNESRSVWTSESMFSILCINCITYLNVKNDKFCYPLAYWHLHWFSSCTKSQFCLSMMLILDLLISVNFGKQFSI